MRKHFISLLCMILASAYAMAQDFPTVSTDEETKWYLIQFMNGGNALTAETDGANITTSTGKGSDAQLWKITGSKTQGYVLTNKKGYTLSVASSEKNQMVRAQSSASGSYKFAINTSTASGYSDGYEIQPSGNTAISMNLWGGPAENRGVGLWDKGDKNNAVQFVDAETFERLGKISIIPYPSSLEVAEGNLPLSSLSAIAYKGAEMKEHVETFAQQLATSTGIAVEVKEAGDAPSKGDIWFGTDEALAKDAYTMSITADGITIKASEFGGWFYALQTMKQLLPREYFASEKQSGAEAWSLPCLNIEDRPHLGHRGYMLDIARHFFNKDEVKKVLDIMALYKMNRFHWHLTDDQGWRIHIPEYPKLTEVGAIRKGSFANNGDGQKFFDDTEYGRGMFYTLDDLREIVAYAKARNIEIIPEVDLPGHMVAAVASYPEFSCDPTKKYEVRIDGGISHDVLNIGDDRVIDFLKCVLGHVATVFPYDYVHIGGDESRLGWWLTDECFAYGEEIGISVEFQRACFYRDGACISEAMREKSMLYGRMHRETVRMDRKKTVVYCFEIAGIRHPIPDALLSKLLKRAGTGVLKKRLRYEIPPHAVSVGVGDIPASVLKNLDYGAGGHFTVLLIDGREVIARTDRDLEGNTVASVDLRAVTYFDDEQDVLLM